MKSVMRRVWILYVLLCVLCGGVLCATAFSRSVNAAFAEDATHGFDLPDGYDVRIAYQYSILYASGVSFGYEVVFDQDFYDGIEDKNTLMNELKETFVKNGYKIALDVDNGKMTASISFSSITDYYVAAGVDGYETDEPNKPVKKGLFYNVYENTFSTKLAEIKQDGKFLNRIYKKCVEYGIEDERILLRYVYGTPYNEKLITSSADSVGYSSADKLYYHTFDFTVATADKTITIRQKSPNQNGWYLVTILIAVAVLSVPLAVAMHKRKEKKNGSESIG